MTVIPVAATRTWHNVCRSERLVADRGVGALVDGRQVAVFLLSSGDVHAVENHDPIARADVMSRGIVGDVAGEPTVASPVYKQRFSLRTGRCLDDESVALRTWPTRLSGGWVQVAGSAEP